MALEHRFIDTNGIRLHCAVDGEGPLVVFLHGFPESSYSWRHQMAALAPRFRVVAPDMRGYGDSDKPEGIKAYDLKELVAEVLPENAAMRKVFGKFGFQARRSPDPQVVHLVLAL